MPQFETGNNMAATASTSDHVTPKRELRWGNLVLLPVLHVALVYGWFASFWRIELWTWVWFFFSGGCAGFGVTAGAHRLWTHRAYKAKWPLRVLLVICYSMAGHNPLFDWVRDHRVHHKYSDTDADPHNAKRGFFFSHVGWLLQKKHPQVVAKGRAIDMSDVLGDPVADFHRRHFIPMQLLFCFVVPVVTPRLWGETWMNSVLMCGVVRYAVMLNVTWSVNSVAHIWGHKPYDRRILPVESRLVSFMSMGEGWHNYHHMFPWDYKAAELGNYCLNLTTFWIDVFAKIGWAYDLKSPSPDLVRRVAQKHGDGSHARWHRAHRDDPRTTDCHEVKSDDVYKGC